MISRLLNVYMLYPKSNEKLAVYEYFCIKYASVHVYFHAFKKSIDVKGYVLWNSEHFYYIFNFFLSKCLNPELHNNTHKKFIWR